MSEQAKRMCVTLNARDYAILEVLAVNDRRSVEEEYAWLVEQAIRGHVLDQLTSVLYSPEQKNALRRFRD